MSAAEIVAVNCVALTNVVGRGDPFQFTIVAPLTKPVPFTVSVNAAAPAVRAAGLRLVMAGTRLIVKVAPPEAAPSAVATVTVAAPKALISAAGTVAVI